MFYSIWKKIIDKITKEVMLKLRGQTEATTSQTTTQTITTDVNLVPGVNNLEAPAIVIGANNEQLLNGTRLIYHLRQPVGASATVNWVPNGADYRVNWRFNDSYPEPILSGDGANTNAETDMLEFVLDWTSKKWDLVGAAMRIPRYVNEPAP